jgi:esterase/lipase superfamily enzyme
MCAESRSYRQSTALDRMEWKGISLGSAQEQSQLCTCPLRRRGATTPLPTLLVVTMISVLLANCASRPEAGFLAAIAETAPGTSELSVLVATTRQRDTRAGTLFNGERSGNLDFATVTVSIPPMHVPGEIEWPAQAPGYSASDFVVTKADYLDGERDFVRMLNAQLALRPRGNRKVLLFIHGYNTVFAEALFRLAQVDKDAAISDVPVLFSWASRGTLADYIYDNNSATAARDDLAHTLKLLFASNAEEINIVAHSMGNWVTVEALRQIQIAGQMPHNSKVGSIFLAAPDIDLDVFKSQLRAFPPPRKPFYVVLSRDDQALQASSFLAGGKDRLGSDTNADELAALGATVIDLTDVRAFDPANHGKFAQLATIAPQLLPVLAKGVGGRRPSGSPADLGQGVMQSTLAIQGQFIHITAGR